MATTIRDELIARLKDHEDSFVERKPNVSDLEPTIVAFANSVPVGRDAIIYVGVGDNGRIIGVDNTDSAQKKIRKMCVEMCYPEIQFTTEILPVDGKPILAVVIPPSSKKPHFTGAAFIRRGSESIRATPELYEDLIASRHHKAAELLRYKNQVVTVVTRKHKLGQPEFTVIKHGSSYPGPRQPYECRVLHANSFYVTLEDIASSRSFSEPLRNLEISYDNEKNRPLLVVRLDDT
jgi:Putative DNA-binding domain